MKFNGQEMSPLLEKVVRAMVASYNKTMDTHVRQFTFEEVVNDPRHGIVQAAQAAIETVKEWDETLTRPST